MSDATVWWLLAGAAVALELVSGTFYLLMLALGLAAAALAAHAGAGLAWQLSCAALVGGGAVLAWSRLARQRGQGADSAANPDLNLDIGQTRRLVLIINSSTGYSETAFISVRVW